VPGQPKPGSINQTVPARRITTLPAASLSGTARYGGGITGTIERVAAVHATARQPGEVAGPAVAITFRLVNGSTRAISLDAVVTNVFDSAGTPGNSMSAPPADPLHGQLAAGKSAVGVYLFTLSAQHRDPVTVTISYSANAPVARFVGALS